MDSIFKIEEKTDYVFQNKALLKQAFTHISATRQQKEGSYERLEFLGDRVLGLIIAEMLFLAFPKEAEGHIAKRHAGLVRKETLALVAQQLNLIEYIRLGALEVEATPINDSMLADVCEAFLGALYLDGGLEPARKLITKHWQPLLEATNKPPQDAKSALQEWAQGNGLERPIYETVKTTGPAHQPLFKIAVKVTGVPVFSAIAGSKKQAEQLAAEQALHYLEEKHESFS